MADLVFQMAKGLAWPNDGLILPEAAVRRASASLQRRRALVAYPGALLISGLAYGLSPEGPWWLVPVIAAVIGTVVTFLGVGFALESALAYQSQVRYANGQGRLRRRGRLVLFDAGGEGAWPARDVRVDGPGATLWLGEYKVPVARGDVADVQAWLAALER